MSPMVSQITSLAIFYSTVFSGADQRKHQSSASLVFVRGIYRSPVNSPHKGPITRKMLPFNDVIITSGINHTSLNCLPLSTPSEQGHNNTWHYRKCLMRWYRRKMIRKCCSEGVNKGVSLTHWPLEDLTEILDDNFQANFGGWWLRYLMWNCPPMEVRGTYLWHVNR